MKHRLSVIIPAPSIKSHVLLNYLGRVEEQFIPKVLSRTQKIVSSYPQFTLEPANFQTLTSRHQPTLLYFDLLGDVRPLLALQKDLTALYNQLGFPQPVRKFNPIITLGYHNRFLPPPNAKDYPIPPPFTVASVALIESLLSKSSTHYQKLATFMLQSGHP